MTEIKKSDKNQNGACLSTETATEGREQRVYTPPQVLSAEHLEAAATTCSPTGGAYGKLDPPACGAYDS